MDTVEAGETYVITRNGAEIAELRALGRRRRLSAQALTERHRGLPRVDVGRVVGDAEAFFGNGDRVANDVAERGRGGSCRIVPHRDCSIPARTSISA
jgi:antitoxin (DNA-binding transcriptional repressor) of toxin-antitoxin stability system